MKKASIIRLENVWKVYQMGEFEVQALKGINLDINKGDFVAITGQSGSGKSTMMNLVGCLDLPSKGSIFLDEKDISELSESALAQVRGRKIGFIFQQFNLIRTLSALDNVMLSLELQGVETALAKKRASMVLNQVGLGDRMAHLPSQLSGGQQQRVAIARALVGDPEVVLADEPTGNLDSSMAREVLALLHSMWQGGKTVVLITHEMDYAKSAHRLIVLKDGLVLSDATKGERR